MEDEDDFMPNLASMLEVSLVEDPDTALSLPATEVAGEKQDNKDENAIRENGNDDSDPESPPKNTSTDVPYSSPGDPHNEGTKDSDSEPSQTTELSQKTEEVVPFPPASVLDTELVDFGQQQLTLSENLSTSIVSDEEMKMYKRVFSDLKKVTRMRLHCTVCDCHIGCTQDAAFNMAFHRALRVLVCKDCETFYETGDFPCGDDGSEMFCCWCGQGGQLFCCSNCPKVFCKCQDTPTAYELQNDRSLYTEIGSFKTTEIQVLKIKMAGMSVRFSVSMFPANPNCIRHNLGRKALQIVIDSKDWMCYNCNARPLWEHRALCWGLSTFLKQQSVGSLKIPAEEAEKCPGFNANLCCKGKKPAYFRAGQPLRLLLPPLYTMVTSVDMESSKLKTLLTPGRSSFSSSSLVTTTASNISSPTTSTLTNTRCTIMNGEGPSNQSLNSSNLAVRAVDQESQVQRPVVMKPRTPQNHVLLAPTLVPFCSPSVPQKVRLVDVQTTPGSIVRFGSVMLSNTNAPVNKVYINQDTTANSVIYTMSGSNTGTVRPVGPSPAKFLVVSPNNEPPLLTPLSSGTKPSGQIHVVAPSVVTIPVTKQSQKEDTVHIDLSGENDDDIVEVFSNVQDSREVVKDFEWMIQSLRKIDRSSKILAFHVEILRRKFMSEVNKKGHNAKGVRHLASKFNHLLGKATGRLAAEQNSIKAGFRDWLTAQKSDKEKSSDAELPEKDPEPPLDLDITCESDHEDANECGEDLSDTDSYSEDPFSDTAILERKVQNPEFKPFHAHTVRDLLRDKYGSKILYEILTDLNSSDDKEKQNAQKGGGVVTPVQDVATQTHESKEFEEVEEESEKKEFKEVEKEKPEKKEFEEVEEEEEPEKKEFEEEKEEPEKKEFEEVEEEEPEKKEFEEEKEEPEKKEFEEEKEEPEKKEFEEMEEEEEPEKKASTDADKCGVTRPTGWSCAFTDFLACTISTPMSSGSSTPSNISESSSRGKSENTVQDDSEHIVNASDTEVVIKQEPEEPEPVAGPSGIKTDSEMNSRKRKHSVSPAAADKRKRDSSSPPIQVPYLQVKENDSEDPVPIVDLTASDIEKILKPCSVAIPRVNTTS